MNNSCRIPLICPDDFPEMSPEEFIKSYMSFLVDTIQIVGNQICNHHGSVEYHVEPKNISPVIIG